MRYQVRMKNIEWDDGKGQYDVSDLPRAYTLEIEAANKRQAIEWAMNEADQTFGSCIAGCEAVAVAWE